MYRRSFQYLLSAACLFVAAKPALSAVTGLSAVPASVTYYAVVGSTRVSTDTAPLIVAAGSGSTNVSVSAQVTAPSGGNWLSATLRSGTVNGGGTVGVSISVNPANLQLGTYNGKVTVSGGGFSPVITVSLVIYQGTDASITAPTMPIALQAGMSQQYGASLTVANGNGVVPNPAQDPNFALSSQTNGGGSWLTAQKNGTASAFVFTVNAAALQAGEYSGTITASGSPNGAPYTTTADVTVIVVSPAAVVSTLSPNSATAGGLTFTLTVNGSGFVSGSTAQWNGSPVTTTSVSASQLNASIPAALISSPGSVSVTVVNPGAGASNAATFTINPPAVTPTIASLSPNSITKGAPEFTLTVTGSGFVSGSTVQWNGSPLSTVFYLDSSHLAAAIPATLIASAGSANVTVVNPGAAASSAATFTVNAAQATKITSLTAYPSTVTYYANGNSPTRSQTDTAPFILAGGSGTASVTVSTDDDVTANTNDGVAHRWLSASLASGTVAGGGTVGLSITVTPTDLSGSQYIGSVTVSVGGLNTVIGVTYILQPGIEATYAVQTPLPITLTVGASQQFTVLLTVDDAGGAAVQNLDSGSNIQFAPGVGWLTAATTSGNTVAIMVNANGSLSVGPHGGAVLVSGFVNGSPYNTNVTVSVLVVNPPPAISGLIPNSAPAGGPAFTLTVNGSGFVNSSTVQWNGSPVPATYVNANQLTASIPASLIASQGSASVTVATPGAATSNTATFTINPPAPAAVSTLSQNSATAGGPAFTLTVNGSGFVSGSTVQWNGSPVSTSFVSANQLNASIPASLLASAGSASVTVVNPGAAASNAAAFTINAPAPAISGLNPNSATAGGPAFTLTVNGSGFVSGSTVEWNGSAVTTSYVSASQLNASIPASLIASQGTASMTVLNPGAAASNALTFTINPPAAVAISALNPNSATAGGAAFTLTVNGSGFVSGSAVQWNGSSVPTSYVSAGQLAASIPASLIAAAGTAAITVLNPGAAKSNVLSFVVNAAPVTSKTPSITAGGILNGASFATGQPVAPGSLVSIFGANLAAASVGAASVPLSTSLDNVTVTFNGFAAPLLYVSGVQVNAQVPFELTGASTAQVLVTNGGAASAPQTVQLASAAPGIFALGGGIGQAVAYGNTDYTFAAAPGSIPGLTTYPAKIGDPQTLVVLATGLGPVTPSIADGVGDPTIIHTATGTPIVTVGNVPAQVVFCGILPGFPGVYQINIVIQPGTPTGTSIPLQIQMGGITTSNQVTIAVSN